MNTLSKNNSRIFTREGKEAEILKEVIASIPKNTKIFVVGGAARNAAFFNLFKEALSQRDYDLLLVGDLEGFVKNLRSHGFTYGRIRRKNEIVLKKKLISKPESAADYLVLDIGRSYESDVLKNLKEKSAFTINGFAVPLQYYLSENIKEHLISLPGAMEDLKGKKLRLNISGYAVHPGNLYACLRFMSVGFSKPNKREIELLLAELPKINKKRFEKNVRKVFGYVGGEKKARVLARRLGIRKDIFDLHELRNK